MTLLPGDRANLETPGGAGFGHPDERDIEAVTDDVRQGYVSAAEAARIYGGALEPSSAPVPAVAAASNTTSYRGDDPA